MYEKCVVFTVSPCIFVDVTQNSHLQTHYVDYFLFLLLVYCLYILYVRVKAERFCSIMTSGAPVVLKFLKFQNCPEIRKYAEILVIW